MVVMPVRFPLSLRNVEALHHQSGTRGVGCRIDYVARSIMGGETNTQRIELNQPGGIPVTASSDPASPVLARFYAGQDRAFVLPDDASWVAGSNMRASLFTDWEPSEKPGPFKQCVYRRCVAST